MNINIIQLIPWCIELLSEWIVNGLYIKPGLQWVTNWQKGTWRGQFFARLWLINNGSDTQDTDTLINRSLYFVRWSYLYAVYYALDERSPIIAHMNITNSYSSHQYLCNTNLEHILKVHWNMSMTNMCTKYAVSLKTVCLTVALRRPSARYTQFDLFVAVTWRQLIAVAIYAY